MPRTRIKVKKPKEYVQVELIHKGIQDTSKYAVKNDNNPNQLK